MPEPETTIQTLLDKIKELETSINQLKEDNTKLKTDNDEIKAFNRQLLNGPIKKVEVPDNNKNKAKEELDAYLKGE